MRKILLLSVIALVGCESEPEKPLPEWFTDQALRHKIFMACLGALPAGPVQTKYNDWDEVVEACGDVAFWQSKVCVKNCPIAPELADGSE